MHLFCKTPYDDTSVASFNMQTRTHSAIVFNSWTLKLLALFNSADSPHSRWTLFTRSQLEIWILHFEWVNETESSEAQFTFIPDCSLNTLKEQILTFLKLFTTTNYCDLMTHGCYLKFFFILEVHCRQNMIKYIIHSMLLSCRPLFVKVFLTIKISPVRFKASKCHKALIKF